MAARRTWSDESTEIAIGRRCLRI